jgi:hypothetical protein
MGTGRTLPGIKQLGREADHSLPYSAEVKNAWSYTYTPPYAIMAWCLIKQMIHLHYMIIKHRDNFTFTRSLSQS